jgi:hypothetical protein
MWDAKGNMTTVDKTWGYVRGADGKLRIVLHHSSLPYYGQVAKPAAGGRLPPPGTRPSVLFPSPQASPDLPPMTQEPP